MRAVERLGAWAHVCIDVCTLDLLNCSRSFVYKLVGAGKLKGLLVTEKSLDKFKVRRRLAGE